MKSTIKITLDRRMKMPPNEQIKNTLKNYIARSAMTKETPLESNHAIAQANQIDVALIDEATAQMVEEGNLIVKDGVLYPNIINFTERYDGSTKNIIERIRDMGYSPNFKTTDLKVVKELPKLLVPLADTIQKEYVRIERVFYANQIPVFYMSAYYAKQLFKDEHYASLESALMYEYLAREYHRIFSHFKRKIDVAQAPARINQLLNQPHDSAVFRMTLIAQDQNYKELGLSLYYSSILYSLESINVFPEPDAV